MSSTDNAVVRWDGVGGNAIQDSLLYVTDAGKVGVNYSTPTVSLHVEGQVAAQQGAPGANGANDNGFSFAGDYDTGMFSTADGLIQFYNNNVETGRITSGGLVGFGTTPLELLHVKESVNSDDASQLLIQNEGAGNHTAGISFQVSSSGETSGLAPKGAILFERTQFNGGGEMRFVNDIVNDINAWDSDSDTKMMIGSEGSLMLGTTTAPTNGAPGCITSYQIASDPTPPTDSVCFYGKDVSGTAEAKAVDEAGNAVQLTPHNFERFDHAENAKRLGVERVRYPWDYHARNLHTGWGINVDMALLARLVEVLAEKVLNNKATLIHEWDFEPTADWDEHQDAAEAAQVAKLAEWRGMRELSRLHGFEFTEARPARFRRKRLPKYLRG